MLDVSCYLTSLSPFPLPHASPLISFYFKRQEAKRRGNEAMPYVYFWLMNSLTISLGINPPQKHDHWGLRWRSILLTRQRRLLFSLLRTSEGEHYYIVTYLRDRSRTLSFKVFSKSTIGRQQLSQHVLGKGCYPYLLSRPDCILDWYWLCP